jgi:acetate kinase
VEPGLAPGLPGGPLIAFPVLCLNSGSSSLKFALYRLDGRPGGAEALLVHGAAERLGLEGTRFWARGVAGAAPIDRAEPLPDHRAAVEAVFRLLETGALPGPRAVGHRLVHGGAEHTAPARVDARLLDLLRGLVPLAPLHLPSEIQVIEAVAARFPGLPQVACFDTAFHRRMPDLAQRLPLPRALWDAGIRRYGFHGLSYEYVVAALGAAARGKLIIAHLGNGASMAAVRDGCPFDTTMGFTPTGGFMMGTRTGDLDPGVILHLLTRRGYDAARLDRLVNHESGLLGVSGLSPDMRTLLEAREHDPAGAAAEAVEMFCYQVRKQIGAFAAALDGLDTLVFTAGIGERAAAVREAVCRGLGHLGVRLDPDRNARHADPVSAPDSRVAVRVIPTNEDLVIARHTCSLVLQERIRQGTEPNSGGGVRA